MNISRLSMLLEPYAGKFQSLQRAKPTVAAAFWHRCQLSMPPLFVPLFSLLFALASLQALAQLPPLQKEGDIYYETIDPVCGLFLALKIAIQMFIALPAGQINLEK